MGKCKEIEQLLKVQNKESNAMIDDYVKKGEAKINSIADKQINPVMRKCKKQIEQLLTVQNKESNAMMEEYLKKVDEKINSITDMQIKPVIRKCKK